MSGAAAFFAYAQNLFESAEAETFPERQCWIAGRAIRFRFSTQAVAQRLFRALEHQQAAESELPDLTVWCWDGGSRGSKTPAIADCGIEKGVVFDDGPPLVSIDIETGRIDAYDPARRLGFYYVPDHRTVAPWDLVKPFLRILHWWAASIGLRLLHGAAMATDYGGALLVGSGGSGKSTTALACASEELRYIADDYCVLEPGKSPHIHSLFSSGSADAKSLALLPHLAAAFEPSPSQQGDKSVVFLAEHTPDVLESSARLRAIVVPQIKPMSGGEARRITPMEALRALAPSTLLQLPGARSLALAQMVSMVREVPCWKLLVGPEPEAAGTAISSLIFDSWRTSPCQIRN